MALLETDSGLCPEVCFLLVLEPDGYLVVARAEVNLGEILGCSSSNK